uniref:(California timema) hypothetical protein n=1 Tax=Timema californicum TaxID=61474 RepID=A0A7R9PEF5_TIMCA|nr:unnamed protein product [Timema californicum]
MFTITAANLFWRCLGLRKFDCPFTRQHHIMASTRTLRWTDSPEGPSLLARLVNIMSIMSCLTPITTTRWSQLTDLSHKRFGSRALTPNTTGGGTTRLWR